MTRKFGRGIEQGELNVEREILDDRTTPAGNQNTDADKNFVNLAQKLTQTRNSDGKILYQDESINKIDANDPVQKRLGSNYGNFDRVK